MGARPASEVSHADAATPAGNARHSIILYLLLAQSRSDLLEYTRSRGVAATTDLVDTTARSHPLYV